MPFKIRILLVLTLLFYITLIAVDATEAKPAVKVPVLCYHHLKTAGPLPNVSCMTETKFLADLCALKRAGYTSITFKELYDYTHHQGVLPAKPIMITFDDGYSSTYKIGYPALKATHMKATVFVIGWCVGMEPQSVAIKPHLGHFSWSDAKEMVDSGLVEVESHTFDLHEITGRGACTNKISGYGVGRLPLESNDEYTTRLEEDFKQSSEDIKTHLGYQPLVLAYPFGKFDPSTEPVAEQFFKGTMTIKPGVRSYRDPSDLYDMPRILVDENLNVLAAIDNWEGLPTDPSLMDMEAAKKKTPIAPPQLSKLSTPPKRY